MRALPHIRDSHALSRFIRATAAHLASLRCNALAQAETEQIVIAATLIAATRL
jgi:hypothetical protein